MNAQLITETRPLPRDTVAAKGCSCGWCRPPSRSGTCCLCRSERDRPPGWGREQRAGSSWPGQWSPVTGEGRFLRPRAAFVPAPGLITRVPAEAGCVAAAGEDSGPIPGPQAPSPTLWNWPSGLRGAGGAHPRGRLGLRRWVLEHQERVWQRLEPGGGWRGAVALGIGAVAASQSMSSASGQRICQGSGLG